MIGLQHYLVVSAILFVIGVFGIFLNRKNVIIILMAIELMLLAVNLNFIAFSRYLGDMSGQVFVFFILTVAAAESAIGLAILVLLFRNAGSIVALTGLIATFLALLVTDLLPWGSLDISGWGWIWGTLIVWVCGMFIWLIPGPWRNFKKVERR